MEKIVREKLMFFAFMLLTGLTLSPIAGGLALLVGHLAGMSNGALMVLFSSTTGGVFTAIMSVAALAAHLFFGSHRE